MTQTMHRWQGGCCWENVQGNSQKLITWAKLIVEAELLGRAYNRSTEWFVQDSPDSDLPIQLKDIAMPMIVSKDVDIAKAFATTHKLGKLHLAGSQRGCNINLVVSKALHQ